MTLTKRSACATTATFTRSRFWALNLTFAADLAVQWADRWKATVNLYRVPFVSHGKQWRPEQMKLAQQFLPTRYVNQRGVA
jgi:hypothetical protein